MNPIICTWSAQLPKGEDIVWPDGCRDLVVILPEGEPGRVICSGLDAAVRRVRCSDATRFLGVRLAPGVIFPWERSEPGRMLTDTELTQYSPSFGRLQEVAPGSDDDVVAELVRQVDSLADMAPQWVGDYLQELAAGEGDSACRLSARSIRRKLVQATGAPPVYWKGLARARRVALAISRSGASLASIAADHGFSDQAHMSREVRRWFGCTPVSLRVGREQSLARLSAPDCFPGP